MSTPVSVFNALMSKENLKRYFNKILVGIFSILFLIMVFLSSKDELAIRSIAFFLFSYFYYSFLKSIVFKEAYIDGIRSFKNDGGGLADYQIIMTFIVYSGLMIIVVFFHK